MIFTIGTYNTLDLDIGIYSQKKINRIQTDHLSSVFICDTLKQMIHENDIVAFSYDCFYHGSCACRDNSKCPKPKGLCYGCEFDWIAKDAHELYDWIKQELHLKCIPLDQLIKRDNPDACDSF
jgi:hypothetical protein